MKKQDKKSSKQVKQTKCGDLLRKIQETEDMSELIELSRHEDPMVRQKAVQQMCPCRVERDLQEFWDKIFELAKDDNDSVRYQVLHNMCDGSPEDYEDKVVECLEIFNRDSDKDIRRKAHKVMGSYLRTGKWNVL